jgi:hypothetical protein
MPGIAVCSVALVRKFVLHCKNREVSVGEYLLDLESVMFYVYSIFKTKYFVIAVY